MRQLCNFANVYTKSYQNLLNVYTNMAAISKKQMVFSYDDSIIEGSGQ